MSDLPPPSNPPPDTAPQPDLSGRQLGDYHVLRRLGAGATAVVYLAEQTSLRRQIALKVLRRDLAEDESYLRRFRNEATAAASLVHANIVQIHEVGQIEGLHFIAQEYVPGRNVGQLVQRNGALNVNLSITIMRQVAAALAKAAEQGVVHRDVKPENILLARTGEVKVADFGLARLIDGDGTNLTQVGVTMGTPLYMSPEQIEGRRLDSRSDVYSFGVTCYHMLTGRPPFHGDTALAVAIQHLNSSPERIENLRPDLPSGLARAIHKMLAKSPDERYQSPRELLAEIRALAASMGEVDESTHAEPWSETELATLGENHLGATARLDELMKTSAMLTPKRVRTPWLVLGMALFLALGALLHLATRGDPLLSGAAPSQVPEYETVWDQLYHAKMTDTPQAWQAVLDRFDDPLAQNLAKQNLARHYLAAAKYEQALPLLDELANLGPAEPEFVVFGQAGQCVVYQLTNQRDKARNIYTQIDAKRLELLDSSMRRNLEEVMRERE